MYNQKSTQKIINQLIFSLNVVTLNLMNYNLIYDQYILSANDGLSEWHIKSRKAKQQILMAGDLGYPRQLW